MTRTECRTSTCSAEPWSLFPAVPHTRETSSIDLAVLLVAFGAINGAMDVAVNAHTVAVEKKLGRTVMSSFHALFSLGGLMRSGSAILLLSLGLTPTVPMACAGQLGLVAVLGSARMLLPAAADEGGPAHAFALPRGPLLSSC